ncbi:hypothetical protein D9M69_568000 [compost metagenome]
MALEQVAVDQRVLVVEGQRQQPILGGELVQHGEDGVGLGQPFQHRVAEHQVVGFGELAEQFLPGRLDEGGRLAGFGEALAGAFEHGFGGFGEGHLAAALGQPERHVAESGADVEHPQGAVGQHFGQVGLEYGEADGALGAAIDLLGEAGRHFIEVAVGHLKRLSLSASLARTTSSMSRPSSAQSSSR